LNQSYAKRIPIERLFIETDIIREPVSNVYEAIAEKLDLSLGSLTASIQVNAKLVFKKMVNL
jgi:Tat protein secretion system quality control protein TatD with DNase activity